MANLCNSLRQQYEQTGDITDLDRSIMAGRLCLERTPPTYAGRSRRLSNLGFALRLRFELLGLPDDIVDSVQLGREALDSHPAEGDIPRLQSNLGTALRVRFELTQAIEDLAEATRMSQQAIDRTARGHPDRPGMLSNLGLALLELAEASHDEQLLSQAVGAARSAVELTSSDDPDRPMYAINLSVALRLRAALRDRIDDCEAAIDAAALALALLPVDHPERAGVLSDLGRVHRLHSALTRDRQEARLAADLRRRAAAIRSAPVGTRAVAARAFGVWSIEDEEIPAGAEGLADAVRLLSHIAWHGLGDDARERHLSRWRGLAEEAASAAVLAGSGSDGMRLLEEGRTVLWNQRLQQRGDLSRLAETAPGLADRLNAIRLVLDQPGRSGVSREVRAW
jgi:tetratricopeptide (TPR) repeat protein